MKRVTGASVEQVADAAVNFKDPSFSEAVIRWQKQHGRHVLPWQNTRDAYRIWLSEIMLQQTQVTAVIPYYQRFLARFPDVASLAVAPSEEVMAHWSGLGYYTRARNLHRCAQRVVTEFAGVFPSDPEVLVSLAGIGRSTAAAIAAFAYGARAAILDGNVKRVFCRVFGIDGYPGEKRIEDRLWQRAVALLPEDGIEAYTQGLMDLGATVCTRSSPACQRCPLAQRCVALATLRMQELPTRKTKKAVPEKHTAMLVITEGGEVLLEQRPDSGIWGGLLSLPEVEPGADIETAAGRFGILGGSERLQPFSHTFTHFKLHIEPFRVRLARRTHAARDGGYVWYPGTGLIDAPLPAPVKKLLLAVFREADLLG